MAFLDNSGDIILDAVLTDVGRRRMAQGNFRITKFSVGDDEIDYALYNKEHPSGSAYYDLEIMQTPILEAFTQINANINYGLVSYPRQDLLYMPIARLNEKSFSQRIVKRSGAQNVIYLADDTKSDTSGNRTSTKLVTSGAPKESVLISNNLSERAVVVETGIDSSDILSSVQAQTVYITSVGLLDRAFLVRFDRRFISNIAGIAAGGLFSNSSRTGGVLNFSLKTISDVRNSQVIRNHAESIISATPTQVFADFNSGTGTDDTSGNFSVITGPRGAFTAFNMGINPNIPQADYIRFGTTSNDLFGDGVLYDFIDTTVYLRGNSSYASLQVPIRIIKLAAS